MVASERSGGTQGAVGTMVEDLWTLKDGKTPSKRYGRGKRWRVRVAGFPTRSFRTRAEADRFELRLRLEAADGRGARDDPLVNDLLDLWLAGKAGLSEGGQGAVKAAAVQVRARWGAVRVSQVEPHEVQTWVATMTAERRRKGLPTILVPASTASRSKALQALSGALAIAVSRGDIRSNPCSTVRPGREEARDGRFLEVDQLARLARAAGDQWSPMVWLLGTTGVRIGECCRLLVGDVDAKRRRLRVRRSKNGRARDVPLSVMVLAMLDVDREPSDPLFVGPRGASVDPDNFRARVFRPATERAGLPDLRIHDLRHTAASLMIASRASIKDVQAALGHKSAKMTLDLYGHRYAGHLDDLAARMDQVLHGAWDDRNGGRSNG